MITRTKSVEDLTEVTEPYRHELLGFDPEGWLEVEENIALTDGKMNFTLFEKSEDGIYTGHYFFGTARGKEALSVAQEFLNYLFTNYNIGVVRGFTPLEKLGARWLSRKLGFKGYGVVSTLNGPCELFILTKQEWKGTH